MRCNCRVSVRSGLFWTAPELLREADENWNVNGMSSEGDMYSGAIILKEIFARNGPYTENEDDSPKGICRILQAYMCI